MKNTYSNASDAGGTYEIINHVNGRRYFGSCANFRKRFFQHRTELRKNRHSNAFLQHDYNKCSETVFEFRVIEVITGEKVLRLAKEQDLLDCNYDGQQLCYNIQKRAVSPHGKRNFVACKQAQKIAVSLANQKRFETSLVSPVGELYQTITNIEQFAKVHGLNSAHIHSVIAGKRGTHKGWHLLGFIQKKYPAWNKGKRKDESSKK